MIIAVKNHLATQFYSMIGASNNLSSVPLPPAPAVKTEGVVSLEDMLKNRSIVCDFGAISPTQREGLSKSSSRVLKETLSEMEDLFNKLLQDPGDFWLKLKFSVVRLKLNNIMVERLLRDYLKRCDLHMKLLGKAEEAANDSEEKLDYYGAQSRSLLAEIVLFEERRIKVLKHIDETLKDYRLHTKLEVHALEKELYNLRERSDFKMLFDKLKIVTSKLRDYLLKLGFTAADAQNNSKASAGFPPLAPSSVSSTSMELEPITESADGMASLVDTITSDPVTTYPWYASDWVVRGLSAYIAVCAAYFLFKYIKGGNGNDGGPTGGSGSGIAPENGLLGILPPKEERDTTYEDIHWWGFWGYDLRFAANPGNGESSVRPLLLVFGHFQEKMMRTIWKMSPNGPRRIVRFLFVLGMILIWILLLCVLNSKSLPICKSSVRKYILLTLSHGECTLERQKLSAKVIISRLTGAFVCKSIIISRESHASSGGFHYHIGIWNDTASKHTALSTLRGLFPEFDGRQLNASFHKGWNSVCRYVLKEDKTPTVWGEESLELVKDRAKAAEGKHRGPDLIKLLRTKNSWEEVIADDTLAHKCLSNYSSVRSTFEDIQASNKPACFLKRLSLYVLKKGTKVYKAKDLNERLFAIKWLAYNLCRKRHLKQRQLFILGCPGTNKTNFVQSLSEFLKVYFVPRRPKDFTGASAHHDLWVIDELSGYDCDLDMLNMLLDGQKVSLDTKYGKVFLKEINVPIILISNYLPFNLVSEKSFESRVFFMDFFSKIDHIDAGRLASTLFVECIKYLSCSVPNSNGLNLLGEELEALLNTDELVHRIGFPLLSVEGTQRVLAAVNVKTMLFEYEMFGSTLDITFAKEETKTRLNKDLNANKAQITCIAGQVRVSGNVDEKVSNEEKVSKCYKDLPHGDPDGSFF